MVFVVMKKDWCYLFGLYLSEGCGAFVYNKEGIRIGGSMTITCGDNITKVFDNINSIFDEVKNTKNNYNVCFFSQTEPFL